MRLKLIIIFALVALLFTGCMSRRGVNSAPGYKVLTTTRGSGSRVANSSVSLNVSGDMSYIDRKYFRRTLASTLERKGVAVEYNSENRVDVRVTKNVLDTRTSGGGAYQNCSAYKLDRKVTGVVEYIIRGKDTYANSINYKFLVKSSSCISYDDAERKARLKLIKRLGEITANKIAAKRAILKSSSSANCAIR